MTPSTREKTETTTMRRTSTDRGHPRHLGAAGGTRCSACPESAILFATGESGGTGCRPGGRPPLFPIHPANFGITGYVSVAGPRNTDDRTSGTRQEEIRGRIRWRNCRLLRAEDPADHVVDGDAGALGL